jgi:endopeptidase La
MPSPNNKTPTRTEDDVPKKTPNIPIVSEVTVANVRRLLGEKVVRVNAIIPSTVSHIVEQQNEGIVTNYEAMKYVKVLVECAKEMERVNVQQEDIQTTISIVQNAVNRITQVIRQVGTRDFSDLLFLYFGSVDFTEEITHGALIRKILLIMQYVRPIGYKALVARSATNIPNTESEDYCLSKCGEEIVAVDNAPSWECFEVQSPHHPQPFQLRVNGISVVIHHRRQKKSILVHGLVDNRIPVEILKCEYIAHRTQRIMERLENRDARLVGRLMSSCTIKDMLVMGKDDMLLRLISVERDAVYILNTRLNAVIKRFNGMEDLFAQRQQIMNLFISHEPGVDSEVAVVAYILYDLMTAKLAQTSNPLVFAESVDQHRMYHSFPYHVRQYFKHCMQYSVECTTNMVKKYDVTRVSLEQQIAAMKAPENVCEKAVMKLREISGKTDESAAKGKQYLEGLLKIPFGIHRREPILQRIHEINQMVQSLHVHMENPQKETRTKLTIFEIERAVEEIRAQYLAPYFREKMAKWTATELSKMVNPTSLRRQSKQENVEWILAQLAKYPHEIENMYSCLPTTDNTARNKMISVSRQIRMIRKSIQGMQEEWRDIRATLDASIYGHDHAKGEILKIIGQWMNGKQTGYCFGFEGPPGIGKTSFAKKGLSHCLKMENGDVRPFAFIALGGSCNGSTLEGHSYTYVNSMWGRIVDILMDAQCMNPIIYIDELDKVSCTEHGKEIIGILMHLIDATQNNGFQDKYFSGIDMDLSKALFIFSYNDASKIDPILLDRIHRVRFDSLTTRDKIVIVRKYMLPEITANMGLREDIVVMSDAIIEMIIEHYTMESGVRKLKEILFDLYGEINLELLSLSTSQAANTNWPMKLTEDRVSKKYLKTRDMVHEKCVHAYPTVGVINGLWANAMGRGGIIPIEAMMFPTSTFLELKLTGQQGDVMKESMNVAKSLAWEWLESKEATSKRMETSKRQGIHVHCPDGATPKDGPSAGTAITLAIYSLLTEQKIRNDVAITGEINLQGNVTEIGGLEQKIMGGIRANVRTFLYPRANERDMAKIKEKFFMGQIDASKYEFISVDHIRDTFAHVFCG